jgi:excisionase family DNA binding protein
MEVHFSEEVRKILSKPTASVDEFKVVMGCGRSQAYQFIRQGGIRTLRIGNRILIPTSAIRSMLDGTPQDAA